MYRKLNIHLFYRSSSPEKRPWKKAMTGTSSSLADLDYYKKPGESSIDVIRRAILEGTLLESYGFYKT
jgi:hypothetical protein